MICSRVNASRVHTDPASLAGDASNLHAQEKLRDGTTVLIRPIHGEDIELERRFINGLSPESRRFRFLGQLNEPTSEMLKRFTHPDPVRDVAFIALIADGPQKREIGVARYSANADGSACECAVTVSDEWHNKGLATLLMRHLIKIARERGIGGMYSIDAADNAAMSDLAAHMGFERKVDPDDAAQVIHTLNLKTASV
ncbi:MAG: GNAT family N-acetyltransferase [Rudaea sp.]